VSVSATYRVRSSIRCSAVSIGKVDRLGEGSTLAEINRAGIDRERGSVEQVGQQTAVVRIPSTGRAVSLLDCRLSLPGGSDPTGRSIKFPARAPGGLVPS